MRFWVLFLFPAMLVLTGCFDTEDQVTLNPDGSGKVVHATYFNANPIGNDNADIEARLKAKVADILDKSQGVDAWSDVTYKIADDGRMYFRGTAYFPNLNRLKIEEHTYYKLQASRDGAGNLVVETRSDAPSAKKPDSAPGKLTEEAIVAKIKEQRAQYQQGRSMIGAMVERMHHRVIVRVSGDVKTASGFTNSPEGLVLDFSGAKLLKTLDKAIADDALIRRAIEGGSPVDKIQGVDQDLVDEIVSGKKAPTRALIVAAKPAFDYVQEVSKAREEFVSLRRSLGFLKTTVVTAAHPGVLKRVQVAEVQFVAESDRETNLRAFYREPGLKIALRVDFGGAVVEARANLERAIAGNGVDVLAARRWNDWNPTSPRFSSDRSAALFELPLKTPDADAKGFKELSGRIHYTIAAGSTNLDLGFVELKEKSHGRELQAMIEKIQPAYVAGAELIQLKLRVEPEKLRGLKLVDEIGREYPLKRQGHSGGNGMYSFTFFHQGRFQGNGKLIAEVFDQLEKCEAPFKLENLDLLGRPVAN